MKKIGLCVRYDCNNYGSMLQILATQISLKKIGFNYELIRYEKINVRYVLRNLHRLFNRDFVRGKIDRIKKKMIIKNHPDVNSGDERRKEKFEKFRQRNIGPYSDIYRDFDNLSKATTAYDAIMVGSDQLWAPAGLESNYYNLMFVKDSIPKVSYATSFGVSSIPSNQQNKTRDYLNRIEYISVRENSGKEIVKKLTGRDVLVALDPTLMLSGNEWEEIFPNKQLYDEEYIFAYFLGKSKEYRTVVMQLGKKLGIKVVTCPHLDSFNESDCNFGDEQRYDIDPVDFLNLIRGAKYICTDSFHGSIFSILNKKQFVTFNRFSNSDKLSKNSRIDSLFENLELNDRRSDSTNARELLEQLNAPIDYDVVDKKLDIFKLETKEFLEKVYQAI